MKELFALITLNLLCIAYEGALVIGPTSILIQTGNRAEFICATNHQNDVIFWSRLKLVGFRERINIDSPIYKPFGDRFRVSENRTISNLTISKLSMDDVTADDAGTYYCTEKNGLGDNDQASLLILKEEPSCVANFSGDQLLTSCTFGYTGETKLSGNFIFKEVASNVIIAEDLLNLRTNREQLNTIITVISTAILKFSLAQSHEYSIYYNIKDDNSNKIYLSIVVQENAAPTSVEPTSTAMLSVSSSNQGNYTDQTVNSLIQIPVILGISLSIAIIVVIIFILCLYKRRKLKAYLSVCGSEPREGREIEILHRGQ